MYPHLAAWKDKPATRCGVGVPVEHVLFGHGLSNGRQVTTTQQQNKFYCNHKALTPEEWAHHKQLGDKLILARKAVVETEKGYEFQFHPQGVTLAELADWVMAESKCCPFFDFHIDLENEGKLICLRLTGAEGIKPLLRSEFLLP